MFNGKKSEQDYYNYRYNGPKPNKKYILYYATM